MLEEKARKSQEITPLARDQKGGTVRLPTSAAQRRLWLLEQLGEAGRAYYMALGLRLSGNLDELALNEALDEILRRHELLRTVFVSVDGTPFQQVLPHCKFVLQKSDLRPLRVDERQIEVSSHKQEEASALLDLKTGPLIRGRLLRVADSEHLLLITMHHIISDGWSLGVFLRELQALYEAFLNQRASPLPELPIQYADYAAWQQKWFHGKEFNEQLSYWRKQLQGLPPKLELPTDHPRPAAQSYRGGCVEVVLDEHLTCRLEALARRHEMTLFMVLYAAFAALLSRVSGQDDIVVGTPVMNRRRPEFENLIGFFVNTLVLRMGTGGALSVEELLRRAKQVTLEAYAHQDLPFEQVVEAVQPQRSLDRNPLFQVMLALQNAPQSEPALQGLAVRWEESADNGHATFDLVLSVQQRGQRVSGELSYSADLFEPATIQRWIRSFQQLLEEMTDAGQRSIGELSILSAIDREVSLNLSYGEQVAYPQGKLIHELFEERVGLSGETLAVVYEHQSFTYRGLNLKANQLARYLRRYGIRPEERVGICLPRGLEMLIGILAVLKAGGAYVPLDPSYPKERLGYMLADAAPRALLTQESLREGLPDSGTQVIALDREWPKIERERDDDLGAPQMRSTQLAYVIYTSGSTGQPKGVQIEHHAVLNLWQGLEFSYAERCDRVGLNASFNFDASLQQLVSLLSGRTLFIIPQRCRQDASSLLSYVAEHQIETIDVTPSQLKGWIGAGLLRSLSSLKRVMVGGEAIDAQLWITLTHHPSVAFYNGYGPTECTVEATLATMKGDLRGSHIGRPMLNRAVYVLDEQRQLVPIGVAGEIYIGGVGVGRGYLNRPELTRERFTTDSFSGVPGSRMYKSGDVGRYRPDGTLEYLGRNDQQVKIRGFRIELGEIEAQLGRHPQVREAAVVVREEPGESPRLVAYVTTHNQNSDEPIDASVLREHLQAMLPEHMIPGAFVTLPRLPLAVSGKLDKAALPVPPLEAYAVGEYEAPEGEIELTLARIWQQLLHVERVGRRDNFFELGGHSLHGMKLLAKVSEQLSVELPGTAIFQFPTIESLGQRVISLNKRGLSDPPRTSVRNLEDVIRSPATLEQLTHWNWYRLWERPAIRQIASAIRLAGALNISHLKAALTEVVSRQMALRTRLVTVGSAVVQEILPIVRVDLPLHDLSTLSDESRASEVMRIVSSHILQPVDITVGPLFGFRLIKTAAQEHVLIVALEHSISDAYSLNVMLCHVFTALGQAASGSPLSIPQPEIHYSDYAISQQKNLASWRERHEPYWQTHLDGCGRTRFPTGDLSPSHTGPGWGTFPLRINDELTASLRAWSRKNQTTLVMTVLTTYIAAVLRWCKTDDTLIQFVTDGRTGRHLQNTIGLFATNLYLRIRVAPKRTFGDLLAQVTEEYCRAYEHGDSSYMDSQIPKPDFLRNPAFNWVPQASRSDLENAFGAQRSMVLEPLAFDHPMLQTLERDAEPVAQFLETGDEILASISFPLNRFHPEVMEEFSRHLLHLLESLTKEPALRL